MNSKILPKVIFSPGHLGLSLANELSKLGHDVTIFTPGKLKTDLKNVTADLSLFEKELKLRGDSYIDLLKKHPFTFITLARQVQAELVALAYEQANLDQFDVIHVYTNEEEIALPFAKFCQKPVVFTHHDPYNFLVRYKSIFPKYRNLNLISFSMAQRKTMPKDTNWLANIYHGIDKLEYKPNFGTRQKYILYLGRIIKPKGLHLAIKAVQTYNRNKTENSKYKLLIAGKHYADHNKDAYWQRIKTQIDDKFVIYLGFATKKSEKQKLLSQAAALIIPSTFDEPFGMVMIEALACGTPVIGLDSGAIPEVIDHGKTGIIIKKRTLTTPISVGGTKLVYDENQIEKDISGSFDLIKNLDHKSCRTEFEKRFTLARMASQYEEAYRRITKE